MKDRLVTLVGGGGFVGRYVAQALLRRGARLRIAERNPKNAHFLKAMANLGQIQFVPADILQPATLDRAFDGADAVVNLVGSFANMQAIHETGAANAARAAAKAGTGRFVQISAIGADSQSAALYGRTKAAGEAAVRAAAPGATIVRPSIVFGREDSFINRFAGLIRMLPVVPVIGGNTKLQPVYAADVGAAVAAILSDGATRGKTFELGGPRILTLGELNQWIADATGRKRLFLDVPDALAGAMATLTGWLPGAPITRDQWLMLQRDNIVAPKAAGLETLGIVPTALEDVAPQWLVIYRRHGRFSAEARAG